MIATLKSEFRKLLTVRSTYVIILIVLVLVSLFAGYGDGFRGSAASLKVPDLLMTESFQAIAFMGLVLAFAGLLLVGHEYRYNTIIYTLTSSNSRMKVLFAKLLAISVFAALASLLVACFAPMCALIGIHLHGHQLVPQQFDFWSVIWRCIFVGWCYAMYAFILIAIMRNQVGAIVTFLLVPLIGESILGLIFKSKQQYFPFISLQSVAVPQRLGNHTTVTHAVTVSLTYIAIGLIVSAFLFIRRDAN
jgi:ABC-type transport system involved in multi-copper enzyme maturation permease subunit